MDRLSLSPRSTRQPSTQGSTHWHVVEPNAEGQATRRLAVARGRRDVCLIPVSSILWIDGTDGRMCIHMSSGCITSDGPLNTLTSALGRGFLRINRNTTVNLAEIGEIRHRGRKGEGIVHLANGTELPVTRRFAPRLRAWLFGEADEPNVIDSAADRPARIAGGAP